MNSAPLPADAAFPAFREFCIENRAELLELLATRTVNTNLVERASSILPALNYIAALTGEPLRLVEMCCSSGLNLLLDEYHYDYGDAGEVGPGNAAVRLSCKVLGRQRPPIDTMAPIAERVGVDLVKVNVAAPDQRMWMQAMLCPEWRSEREHLTAALPLREMRAIRTLIGNALEVLPTLLEEFQRPTLVLHSYCMEQWPAAARAQLDAIFRKASQGRDIHRLGLEVPDHESSEAVRHRLGLLASARISIRQKCLPARIEHTHYRRGDAKGQLLGHADGFGAWIEWKQE